MRCRRQVVHLVVAAGTAAALASPSAATTACARTAYAYAGLQSPRPASGVAATIRAVAPPSVASGHVAAWVGVNGPGEWLQVGTSAFPGSASQLYYELQRPGEQPHYVQIGTTEVGAATSLAVLEVAGRPDVWRVWVDGVPQTPPILLPGSHGTLHPTVTAESWDGGQRVCNGYRYRFDAVRTTATPGGRWQPLRTRIVLHDRGYAVRFRSLSSFVAAGG